MAVSQARAAHAAPSAVPVQVLVATTACDSRRKVVSLGSLNTVRTISAKARGCFGPHFAVSSTHPRAQSGQSHRRDLENGTARLRAGQGPAGSAGRR